MFKTNKQVERYDAAVAAVKEFQQKSYDKHDTYAFAAGFLGSMLVDQLVVAKQLDFDLAMRMLKNATEKN